MKTDNEVGNDAAALIAGYGIIGDDSYFDVARSILDDYDVKSLEKMIALLSGVLVGFVRARPEKLSKLLEELRNIKD